MFVDASALCSVLLGESDAEFYDGKLAAAEAPITSPIAVFEVALAIARESGGNVMAAKRDVADYLSVCGVRIVEIGEAELTRALDAFDRFGKGRHAAQLNLGDCFAYGCARAHGVPLLFKGDDFTKTDIVPA